MNSFRPLAAAALAALLSAAAPALAQEPAPGFVRAHAVDMLEGALVPEQVTTLQLVAYQAAVAAACTGFTLDEAKFTKVFDTLAPVDAAKMTDEQKAYNDQHLLVIYGILVGGELADMADDPSAACAAAETTRTDPDMAELLVWQ